MMQLSRVSAVLAAFLLGSFPSTVSATSKFNQSAGYVIDVVTTDWSNYDADFGGCVTCPYTCTTTIYTEDGTAVNSSSSVAEDLPSIYSEEKSHGCCYVDSSDSSTDPSCSTEANPASAEPCGFLTGPSLKWRIANADEPPSSSVIAMLLATIDCETFWAIGETPIKYTEEAAAVSGSKVINNGCYGDSAGVAMALVGCLTTELTYDSSSTYTWEKLAGKCAGLSGKCVLTNGIWGEHLKCCTKSSGLSSDWDKSYKLYTATTTTGVSLSGPEICLIVFLGVGFLIWLVHCGAKVRERAHQTAMMREQEASDDYDEIMTPLTGAATVGRPMPLQRPIGPASLEISLHEGDQIFQKPADELLYEGDLN